MRYSSLDALPHSEQDVIRSNARPDEEYVFGIEVYHGLPLLKRRTTLVLTTERILELKRQVVNIQSRSIDLDDVERVAFSKGLILRSVVIQGPGFSRSFRSLMGTGREFVEKTSEQLST